MDSLLNEFAPLFKKQISKLLQSGQLSASELRDLFEIVCSGCLPNNTEPVKEEEPPIEIKQYEVAPNKPKEATDFIYTKEAIRELLTTASKQGVKIQPIMEKYIPEGKPNKLSSIPSDSYAALAQEIENAR